MAVIYMSTAATNRKLAIPVELSSLGHIIIVFARFDYNFSKMPGCTICRRRVFGDGQFCPACAVNGPFLFFCKWSACKMYTVRHVHLLPIALSCEGFIIRNRLNAITADELVSITVRILDSDRNFSTRHGIYPALIFKCNTFSKRFLDLVGAAHLLM